MRFAPIILAIIITPLASKACTPLPGEFGAAVDNLEFRALDCNQDDRIDIDELSAFISMNEAGISPDNLMILLDEDGSSDIDALELPEPAALSILASIKRASITGSPDEL